MRAVIYTRVSQDKRDRASVLQQEDEARSAAAALGWTVTRVFVDNDVSASRHARKVRKDHPELLAHIQAGAVDVLILWETSRGDRDNTRWSGLLDLCRDRGVRIHVVDHRRTYDLSVPRDWKTLADEGVNNAYASEETRERILRDVRANAVKGRPHGKLPYGYGREYDDRGTFVRQYVKEDEAAVILDAGRRTLAGESLYAIATDLNVRGIPAPMGGKWIPMQVKRLLVNPRYIGQRVHRGQVIGAAVWPAILDEDVYLRCKAILMDPARLTVRDRSVKHLLSGIALCGVCGATVLMQKNRGYHTYICRAGFCTAARTTPLEEFVTALAVERLSRPDFLAAVAARSQDHSARAEAVSSRNLQERLDGFYAAAAAGELTPRALAVIEAKLLPQIEEAGQRALAATVAPVLRQVAGPDIAARWGGLEIGVRRRVVDALMVVRINRTVRGTRFTPARVDIDWRSI